MGDGANNFGPRTEAKVKAFQQKFKIDYGKKDYMDGKNGSHTYDYLDRCVDLNMRVFLLPELVLPIWPPPPKRPSWPMPIPGGTHPLLCHQRLNKSLRRDGARRSSRAP